MGHKVNPKIHRTQVIYSWDSKWFSKNAYAKYAEQDIKIREYVMKKFRDAHIDAISVERGPKNMTVTILAAKPGYIIGRGGQGLDDLRKHIERKLLQMSLKVKLNIREVRNPALSSSVVAQSMAQDIEKRIPFRRVMKQTVDRVMKAGALGVKIRMAGRLNGVEISRSESLAAGKIPLITLRSDVDYAYVWAHTMYGKIGIKVWIYKGMVFGRKDKFEEQESAPKSDNKRKSGRPRRNSKPEAQKSDK
ncbi:30S ribosomal protein S3 [Candidatus Nomurabacteria bacterium]|nr:30S ribosomal protein S3 [Candidatus Nomurabacteria bacterium]